MRLDQVAEAGPLGARDDLHQLMVNAVGIVTAGQTEALGNPDDVRVHGNRRLAEGIAEEYVGGLEAHPG